jgi:basic amino acid/polyamine antiporter, APA family
VAALLTALSYASLGSHHPHAGGVAYVVQRAYGRPLLSLVVGLAVACSALMSVATQALVFAANLGQLLGVSALPLWVIVIGFLLILTGLELQGITWDLTNPKTIPPIGMRDWAYIARL